MTRKLSWSLIFGALCLLGLLLVALFGAKGVMHSYLAGWLVLLALPAGALPLVMALEVAPMDGLGIAPALRRLLWLMPAAAVLAVPALIACRRLYPDLGHSAPGFPQFWYGTGFFVIRAVLILVAWTGLALVFVRPSTAPRHGLAGLGLALHILFVTIVAQDWILALEPTFTSSVSGLLLLAAQCGLAIAAAGLMSGRGSGEVFPSGIAAALVVSLAIWLFLTFTQYLVIWSANLPAEAAWYGHRSAYVGAAAEGAAGLVCLLSFLMLLNGAATRSAGLVKLVATLIVLLHAFGMLWLVTPAIRGHFSVTMADLLALVGLTAFGAGLARVVAPAPTREEVGRG